MIKYNTPQELFTAICDKIRDKTNSNELINHQDIPDKIDELVDSDIINEYNQLLEYINGNCSDISNDKIKKLNIKFERSSIASIDLPECTNIKTRAFSECYMLRNINLPKCTSIGDGAFEYCNELTTVDLPECTSIESLCFSSCKNLTSINLPKCTSIGDSAFRFCSRLTTVDLPECISLPNMVFDACGSLTTINLPKCTSIGNGAFGRCSGLTTVDLPKCTSIGNNAFQFCDNLVTVNLPECTSIGDNAFNNHTNLTTLILNSNQIVHVSDSSAFNNTPIANGTGYIYVPDNLVDSYKTATNWSTYASQIKPISELPSELKEEYNYL